MRGQRRGASIVPRRAFAQRGVLAATFASLLVALTAITVLAAFTQAVPDAGVRATLKNAPARDTGVKVTTSLSAHSLDDLDARAREAVSAAFGAIPTSVYLATESISYDTAADDQIVGVVHLEGVSEHAELISGTWPSDASGGPIQVAVPESVATDLNWSAGTTTHLTSRLTEKPVDIVVTAVYRASDPGASFWLADPFGDTGVRQGSLTTYGPVLVTREAFVKHFGDSATVSWQVDPDLSNVTGSQAADLSRALPTLRTTFIESDGFGTSATFTTGLPAILDAGKQAADVSRSTLLIPLGLLGVLAVSALLLPARLIAGYREGETALLRARGASRLALIDLAAREGVLLVVPAAAVTAATATQFLHLISRGSGLRSAGVDLTAAPGAGMWTALGAGALTGLCVLLIPWLRAGTDGQTRQRAGRVTALQRAGLDVALAVLALLAYWEVRSGASGGNLLVVLAPPLAVVAGALLAMRLLPLVARAIERPALRGRSMSASLASAQVARRPSRHVGPALLVSLALAIGTLTTAYGTTWRKAQQDRADFAVGADVRLDTPTAAGAVSWDEQGAAYAALPGVTATMPVLRRESSGGSDRPLVVLGVDALNAPLVMAWRSDLRPQQRWKFLAPLADARPEIPGAPLPEKASSIVVTARLDATYDAAFTRVGAQDRWDAALSVLLVEPSGMLHRVELGRLPADGTMTTLTADIPKPSEEPWAVAGFDLSYAPLGQVPAPSLHLWLDAPEISRDGTPEPLSLPQGADWQASAIGAPDSFAPPSLLAISTANDGWLDAQVNSGAGGRSMGMTSRSHVLMSLGLPLPPSGKSEPATMKPLAGITTSKFLARTASSVGSTISVPFGGRQIPVQVVGSVEAIPTVGEDSDGLIIDLQALNVAAIGLGWPLPKANEWWLATGSSDEARVTLESDPKLAARVQDRHHVAAAQWRDPFARGAQTALLIGFVAALLFAAIGFVVNAAITARERRAELSLLRALGTRPGTLTRAIAVEQLIVVGLGAVVGLLLGAVVAHEVLPLIIASPDGSLTPSIAVTFPWRGLSFMLAGSVAGLLAVTLAVARASTRTVSAALQNVDDSR